MSLVRICLACLNALSALHQRPLAIAETGTTFLTVLEANERDLRAERSTLAIADWMSHQPILHSFVSIDLEAPHQAACAVALENYNLQNLVEFRLGRGVAVLTTLSYFSLDFVLLDSDSDADVIYGEWTATVPRMKWDGIVVIDDAFKHESVNKARKVLERTHHRWFSFLNQAVALPFGLKAEKILENLCP